MSKVLLGMSGGVDSSVSAILLQQQGYEVIGCTMRLWDPENENEDSTCCGVQAIHDAKRVCDKLGIPHYTINCREEFKHKVVDHFIDEYSQAKTPNPCIECNKYLKFGEFYKKAKELDCEYIATGHYAKTEYSEKYNQIVLKKSEEEKKDQTYFLYTISQDLLEHIIFPLQDYNSKQDTRKIAKENGLEVAEKKDSQEICFIPNNSYKEFLKAHMKNKPVKGNIVLKTGEILGEHEGVINYTVGQRKGLGIAYKEPLYVIQLDAKKNQVIVGLEKDLYEKTLYAKNIHWIVPMEKTQKDGKIECYAKIRYRSKQAKANLYLDKDNIRVEFEEPQRAITPGQAIVFYDEEGIVLGGGKISSNYSL